MTLVKRHFICSAALCLAALACGCSSHRADPIAWAPAEPTAPPPIAMADSRLLFDPGADHPAAADLYYRSDWPSTPTVYRAPEHIAYRETIYDIQGLRGFSRDLTYRRFRVERVGRAIR